MKPSFYINLQLLELEESMLFSPKQGLASIKVFFPTPLNNKLCPYPKTLTAVLRGCVRELVKL